MSQTNGKSVETWGSNLGFVLAMAGSAIGLGNIWRFPYIAGMNGGGCFLMVYLCCVLVIGLPLLLCEFSMGRESGLGTVGAFRSLGKDTEETSGKAGGVLLLCLAMMFVAMLCFSQYGIAILVAIAALLVWKYKWTSIGILHVAVSLLVLSYYAVVGGWVICYIYKSFSLQLHDVDAAGLSNIYENLANNPIQCSVWQIVFMLACAAIAWFGIKRGIETTSKVLLPLLFVLLFLLVMRALTLDGSYAGAVQLLAPDWSLLNTNVVLTALGQALYSLSLGMGISITYGSHLSKKTNLLNSALGVAALDTAVAVMAGLTIFPTLSATGLGNDVQGPGLVFKVMPLAFIAMPDNLDWLWNGSFFILLSIAAVTSGVSMLEVVISFCMDEFKWGRKLATSVSAVFISLIGLLSAANVGNWTRLPRMHKTLELLFDVPYESFFVMLDEFCNKQILPLAAIFTAIFVGWIYGAKKAACNIDRGCGYFRNTGIFEFLSGFGQDNGDKVAPTSLAVLWGFLTRIVSPIAIVLIVLHMLGIL